MRRGDTEKKFAFDVGWALIGSAGIIAVGFFLNIIIGNFFGPEGLGIYSIVLIIYMIASLISGIGIPPALIKYVAEYKEEREELNSVVSCGIINLAIFGSVTTIVLYILSDMIADLFHMPQLAGLLKIIAFIFPFLLLNEAFLGLLNGLRKMKLFASLMFFRRVFVLALTIAVISIGWGIKGTVEVLVYSEIGIFILSLFLIRNFFGFTFKNYLKTTKKLVSFGVQLFLANLAGTVKARADIILIGYFLMERDVGLYSVAVMAAGLMLIIPDAIQKITYPAISEYNRIGEKIAIEKMINTCVKYSFIMLSLLGILLIFFVDDIILLLFPSKPEFLLATMSLRILVLATIFGGAIVSVGAVFSSVGRPDIPLKISMIALIISVCLNILLIPRNIEIAGMNIGGINGAAIATATPMFLNVGISIVLYRRILNVKFNTKWLIKSILILGITYSVMYISGRFVNHYFAGIVGILLYICLLVFSKVITKQDKDRLLKIIRRN